MKAADQKKLTTQNEDESSSRRSKILTTAADVFAQQGFDGTSFGTVAQAADVKKSLVQYHFKSKEKLWQESIHWVWKQRDQALPKYLQKTSLNDGNDNAQMVRELCKQILQFTFDHPQWVKLMFQEASTPSPRLDWMVETFFKKDFANGKAVIELAQQQNLLPKVDAMDLLHILSGALIYLVNVAPISQRVLGENPNSEKYIDRHIHTLVCLLQGTPSITANS